MLLSASGAWQGTEGRIERGLADAQMTRIASTIYLEINARKYSYGIHCSWCIDWRKNSG